MKKLLLTIALVLTSILMNAQTQKMSNEFLEGQWTSNGKGTEIWFNVSDIRTI